jgi:hypothetical protein
VSRRWLLGSARRPWAVGLGLAVVVVGPALAPGSLLNLDLVVTPEIPVPPGIWGLGPELPRRVPFFVPLAWASALIDGTVAYKALLLLVLAVAFVGTYQLAAGAPGPARLAAGLVYAAGPFLATRLAIGHLGTALATAVLPWALPSLLRPAASLRRTLLWSAALGFCGINGGILAGLTLLVGLVAERGRRAGAVLGVAVLGQLPWLVPGLVVTLQGVDPAGADPFGTRLDGPLGLLRLTGGQGFWIADFDMGEGRLVVPLAAAALLVLAVLGRRALPASWGGRALALAAVGFGLAAASGLPLVEDAYEAVGSTTLGQPLREGHRVLPLFLVWLAPAAALGSARVGRNPELGAFLPLAAALALVGPSLWGFGGQLDPVRLPGEWGDAREAVEADPGPVLALPWGQYLRPAVNGGGLVHNPVPFAFGGDVLIPSGRGVEGGPDERADPREQTAGQLSADLQAGRPADFDALGIRWVTLVEAGDRSYDGLEEDPALVPVVDGATLRLYRVRDAVDADVDPVLAPLATAPDGDARTWYRPGATGWLRGLEPAEVTDEGNLSVPQAAGPIWYWPTLLVLGGHLATLSAVLIVWRRHGDAE